MYTYRSFTMLSQHRSVTAVARTLPQVRFRSVLSARFRKYAFAVFFHNAFAVPLFPCFPVVSDYSVVSSANFVLAVCSARNDDYITLKRKQQI